MMAVFLGDKLTALCLRTINRGNCRKEGFLCHAPIYVICHEMKFLSIFCFLFD